MNNELIRIIENNIACYPLMTVQDIVKLIYQNEFAGGHHIADFESMRDYIYTEYRSIDISFYKGVQKYEYIGGGLCRANLALFSLDELDDLAKNFFISSNNHKGSIVSYMKKLNDLRNFIKENNPFGNVKKTLEEIDRLSDRGISPIHHSDIYRETYKPAYRIVDIIT